MNQPQARNISHTDHFSVQMRTTGSWWSASRGVCWRLPAADASLRTISGAVCGQRVRGSQRLANADSRCSGRLGEPVHPCNRIWGWDHQVSAQDARRASRSSVQAVYHIAQVKLNQQDVCAIHAGCSMQVRHINHVRLAMPVGREDEARAFYRDVIGISEVEKPPHLAARGGAGSSGGR
jgi:hypothetical protein